MNFNEELKMNRIPGCFLLLDFSTFQRIAEFEIGENQGNCIQVETVARLSITLTENISMGFLTTEECSPFFWEGRLLRTT